MHLLALALLLGSPQDVREEFVSRVAKETYLGAVKELERATEILETDPRSAIAMITGVLSNPKVSAAKTECRLKIEVQSGTYEYKNFFPYQLRGKANLALAKRAPTPDAALAPIEAAIADFQKSAEAKVGGSADLHKEAKAQLEKTKAAIEAARRPDDPIEEFRPKFRKLIEESKFRSAVTLVKGAEGQKLSEEQRTGLLAEAEDECRGFLDGRLKKIRDNLGDPSLSSLRSYNDSQFRRAYVDPVPAENELTESLAKEPTLAWTRRHIVKTLKSIHAKEAKPEDVFAAATEALAIDPPNAEGDNPWFRAMALYGSELVEEAISKKVKESESRGKVDRLVLQREAEKAHGVWREFVEKTDKKVLERHPDLGGRSERLVEASKGFPAELTELTGINIDACFLGDPGPELIKIENKLRDLESNLQSMGRVAIESRQELYTKLIVAGALQRIISNVSEGEIMRELRPFGGKLKDAGGPLNPDQYGPKVKKVFDELKKS